MPIRLEAKSSNSIIKHRDFLGDSSPVIQTVLVGADYFVFVPLYMQNHLQILQYIPSTVTHYFISFNKRLNSLLCIGNIANQLVVVPVLQFSHKTRRTFS